VVPNLAPHKSRDEASKEIISIEKEKITPNLLNPPTSFQPYTLLQFGAADDRYG
jgi:hypothetical protein